MYYNQLLIIYHSYPRLKYCERRKCIHSAKIIDGAMENGKCGRSVSNGVAEMIPDLAPLHRWFDATKAHVILSRPPKPVPDRRVACLT